MIVSGLNTYHNLFAFPTNPSDHEVHKYVYPPRNIAFDQSDVLSISFYYDHSIIVFKNGRIAGIGNNGEGQLGPFFDHLIYNRVTYGHGFVGTFFISAVCGAWYTLYMHVNEGKETPKATICFSEDEDKDNFSYIDISTLISDTKFVPAAIFGGSEKSAIIDEKGNVIMISREINDMDLNSSLNSSTNSLFATTSVKCEYLYFPRSFFSEKAICVACCNNFTVVLTKSGKVYGNGKINSENGRHVSESDRSKGITDRNSLIEIEELKNHNIIQISGTFQHVLAVSTEGRVFGVGSNFNGQLGIGPEKKNTWIFEEVQNITPKYRIINTSSGSGHSIFISDEGKVLTCGNNGYHQLFQDNNNNNIGNDKDKDKSHFYATEIQLDKTEYKAKFSIAGNCLSGLFINTEAPPNQPNTPIKTNRPYVLPEKSLNDMYKHARNEMARLHFQIETMSKYEDEYKKTKLKCNSDENFFNRIIQNQSNEILRLKDEIEELTRGINYLENANNLLNEQIDEYNKNHQINQDELIGLNSSDANEYLKSIGIDLPDNETNINIIDADKVEKLYLDEIESNDSDFNEFKVEEEKLYSIVVLKKSKNSADFGDKLKKFFNEYEKLSKLKHPNIVKTLGFIKGDSTKGAGIIQEYYSNKITKEIIQNYKIQRNDINNIIKEIIQTIEYLHSKQIYNCQIKPQNISIESNKHIKLHLHPHLQQQQKSYNCFEAPEINQENNNNQEKADIYTIGIFIIYLFKEFFEINKEINEENIRIILKEITIPNKIKTIIEQMISIDPNERPNLVEIKSELDFETE